MSRLRCLLVIAIVQMTKQQSEVGGFSFMSIRICADKFQGICSYGAKISKESDALQTT